MGVEVPVVGSRAGGSSSTLLFVMPLLPWWWWLLGSRSALGIGHLKFVYDVKGDFE